jgi:hypothetical protein
MSARLDLIIPGLFDLPVDTLDPGFLEQKLPALNSFLRFARPGANDLFELEAMLSDCMGWKNNPLPFAQAFVDQQSGERHQYILFRPVHLKADMHNAIVLPLQDDQTNRDDINILINDLENYFNVDCDISAVAGGYWLMRLKQCDPPHHYPHYLSVNGRKADPYTEQSKQRLPWYRLINEMQMYLHVHEINQNRFQAGLRTINSLWFWGAGSLPQQSPLRTGLRWVCDDELLKQFARVSGIETEACADLERSQFNQDSVICDLSLLEALKTDNEVNLQVLLERIEAQLFSPLLRAVRNQQCSLKLRAGSRIDYQMKPRSRFKWWTKPKNLLTTSEYGIQR